MVMVVVEVFLRLQDLAAEAAHQRPPSNESRVCLRHWEATVPAEDRLLPCLVAPPFRLHSTKI